MSGNVRQIVLDTETTGLDPAEGHRIIEIGCVEIVDRRLTQNTYHRFLNPERDIDEGALEVHGITAEQLVDKPRFGDIAGEFLELIDGAELIIHNAAFDVGFLNHELGLLDGGSRRVEDHAEVLDTLELARKLHPGMKNSLDALCKRYEVDNTRRQLHGALLDAGLLADVYLAMTGGQTALALEVAPTRRHRAAGARRSGDRPPVRVLRAGEDELAAHRQRLEAIDAVAGAGCLWLREDAGGPESSES